MKWIRWMMVVAFVFLFSKIGFCEEVWPMFHHDPQHTGRTSVAGPQTPVLKWSVPVSVAFSSSPVIDWNNSTIYIGAEDNGVYAFNLDGSLKWKFATGSLGAVRAVPAIGKDGTVYVGSFDKYFYAINPDGSLKWKYLPTNPRCPNGNWIESSAVIDKNGIIYVGTHIGVVYAFFPDGNVKWTYDINAWVQSSPALSSDESTIYVGANDGYLSAINASDGSLKWRCNLGAVYVFSSPTVGPDGVIYVGTIDSVDADKGSICAVNPDGSLKWKVNVDAEVDSSPAISLDGSTIYVGKDQSQNGTENFFALNTSDGSIKWKKKLGNFVFSSPAIDANGTIYVGASDKNLYAFNPDGSIKWTFPCDSVVDSSPAIGADGTVYIASAYHLYALKAGAAKHTLNVSVNPEGAGAVVKNPDQTEYEEGTQVTLTAVESLGYKFDYWSGDISSSENPVIITMNGNKNIIANFKSVSSGGGGGGGGGCFIATAAFGSYQEKHVWILRQFRDKYLLTNPLGKMFVKWYYRHSPKYANIIAQSESLRSIARISLLPLYGFAYIVLGKVIWPMMFLLSLGILFFRSRKSIEG